MLPFGDWRVWVILAGRGFGKTRTASETARIWVRDNEYVNIIGSTADDVRDIMVEGESGILACCNDNDRPQYIRNRNILKWPNGAKSLLFTAEQPERLRGKQHGKLLLDELAAWRYPETYVQAMLGLRLGNNPQALITTTPRPIKLLKDILADAHTVVTRGSTYDNRANLAQQFVDVIIARYEGTRLGRQEINAEILDDNPNALWSRARIDELRIVHPPCDLVRICVGVDPAVTSTETSNDTGIVIAGLGVDGRGYVLADKTVAGSPDFWIQRVVDAYRTYEADIVIGEVNNGGELIEALLRTKDRHIHYRSVHATRGKIKRAEPIAALYEQGKVSHCGSFPDMEDQMCNYNPEDKDAISPDRMDALVWALSELMLKQVKPLLMSN